MSVKMKLSKRESSGALSLVIVILVVQTVIFIFQPQVEKEIEEIETTPKKLVVPEVVSNISSTNKQTEPKKNIKEISLQERYIFKFDPNTITLEELVKLGLTPKQASVVINYRSKGGTFKKREDFNKIYVLPQGFYDRVKDSISIRVTKKSGIAKQNQNCEQKELLIELNSADSIDLLKLPGIGPYYAKKIIEYREKSGGLIAANDLMKIKGIDSIRFSGFASMVFVDTLKIIKKDINRATIDELSRHPHIGPYLARAIVRFRELSGREGVTLASLVLNKIVAPEISKKLKYFFN